MSMKLLPVNLRFGLIAFGVSVLSACGLIPPQTLENPLRLEGQEISVVVGGTFTPQLAGLGNLELSFEDSAAINLPISPKRSLLKVKLGSAATLESSDTFTPCGVIITGINLKVTLADTANTLTLDLPLLSEPVTLEQQKGSNTFTNLSPDATLSAQLTQSELSQLETLLTSGGTNTLTANLSVKMVSVPDVSAGSVLTLSFGSSEALIGF